MPDQLQPGCDAANLEAMGEAVVYQAQMRQLVADALKLGATRARVLDFGAGRGDYAAALQRQTGSPVMCLEPDVTLHRHYPPSLPVVAGLEQVEPGLACAYSLNVFEHIPDDAQALRSLAARCAPGARIFILVPAYPALWTPMDTLVGHRRRYTPAMLRTLVDQAGLVTLKQGWFDRTGYFATRAYQLLHRTGLLKPQRAGAVSKTQIRCFDILFRMAEPLMRRLPFGKNCWVLAEVPG